MILDGKVATPKEEWDYKMALNRARFEEQQYQNRSTHSQGREVASPAPSGGPNRGGKAKYTFSKTFDNNGEVITETNQDDDGVVTEVKTKTPASFFEMDEQQNYEALQQPSIAIAPDEPVVVEEAAPEESSVDATESGVTIVSKVPWNEQFEEQTFGQSITGDTNNREPSLPGYQDFTTTYSNGLVTQEATVLEDSADDRHHWDFDNQKIINDEDNTVISRTVNGDGTVTYLFNYSPGVHPLSVVNDTIKNAQEKITSAENQIIAVEAEIENAALQGRVVSEFELLQLEAELEAANQRKIEGEEELIIANQDIANQSKQAEEIRQESIIEQEAIKQEEELKANLLDDSFDSDDMDLSFDVEKAVKVIADDDPTAIKELNDFADWAETVSDEESQKAAEEYLQSLADTPTVDQRFKKAMAIAFAAMLFGDDFSTAMNTGFGVVADDYTEEKLEAKAIADADAALAKKIAEEKRALEIDNIKSARDHYESLEKLSIEKNYDAIKLAKEAEEKRKNKNVELGDAILKSLFDMNNGHDNFHNLSNKSVSTQMAGLLAAIEEFSPDGFKLDLRDNIQREALGSVLKKFVSEQLHFKDGTAPALADYAEEMFVKIELEQYTDISPDLIAPSRAYLQKVRGVDMQELDKSEWHGLQQGTKETLKLGETIQAIAKVGNMGEQKATHLLYKDFLMFQKFEDGEPYEKLMAIADSKGVGHFTQFVNVYLNDLLEQNLIEGYGMNFDPAYDAISRDDYTSDEDFRDAQNNYIWKYIADKPQDFK